MSLNELVKMSNRYGSDARFVLAGGGNTSYKDGNVLYIKGSGTALATIQADGFVKMDREKLAALWARKYPEDVAAREKEVLADLTAAKLPGEELKRPSVETLLHDLLDFKLVLHVHPALVNGLTCCKGGKKRAREIFSDCVWIDAEKPGFVLAAVTKTAVDAYQKANRKPPELIFIENHGVFFGADTLAAMDKLVGSVMDALNKRVKREPGFSPVSFDKEQAATAAAALRTLYAKYAGGTASAVFEANAETQKLAASKVAFAAVGKAFTPDHIVYCKAEPLYLEQTEPVYIEERFTAFRAARGYSPKITFVKGLGMFAMGKTRAEAATARDVWLDEIKIGVYAESFGGGQFMTDGDIDFILNWEAESYRQKISIGAGGSKRLEQKIIAVTGAAQGFGRGIAEYMLKEGAYVALADLNYAGAQIAAAEFCQKYGAGRAFAVKVDVSQEADVADMVYSVAINFGGLDALVNNAGVVRAGSLEETDLNTFDFVTRVNYNAYFLCCKYVSRMMKAQYALDKSKYYDIIQINSKSGLQGSNKNFSYAGTKFGGIGLTQSFALELVPYNIKVNAVCPGNFYEGPLWADPDKGLFIQYLKAGKVPGAKSVDDVKKFYEAKAPMNRGCREIDVARAIYYVIEQEYETGQAIPVTGGQVMLN
ncbi:MAG: SDR family NAD(P)-dependent oxidoreductase [Firmicutes bacterium]|nr:SDR family NAD(P)-dependent oxidoreductase [Bacillota bacterium]